jgi:hypothetical protein
MLMPKLKSMGTCFRCVRPVEIPKDSMFNTASEHEYRGLRCKGSGFSVNNRFYDIPSKRKALEVARFLCHDTSVMPHRLTGSALDVV